MMPGQDPSSWRRWQTVLNTRWPADPRAIGAVESPVTVEVAVIWEQDGPQLLEGLATRWDGEHVYVNLEDPRLASAGVWVAPSDVRRADSHLEVSSGAVAIPAGVAVPL